MAYFDFCFNVLENGKPLLFDIECMVEVVHEKNAGLIASNVRINGVDCFQLGSSRFCQSLGAIALEYAQNDLDREGPLYKRAADSFEEDVDYARENAEEARAEAKMERWAEREVE